MQLWLHPKSATRELVLASVLPSLNGSLIPFAMFLSPSVLSDGICLNLSRLDERHVQYGKSAIIVFLSRNSRLYVTRTFAP
jgi:hypothetical protein